MRGILAIPLLAFVIGCVHHPATSEKPVVAKSTATPSWKVNTGFPNADAKIEQWLREFVRSEFAHDPTERPIAYGLGHGGAFVVLRNNNRYVYVDSADDIGVEGWDRIDNQREGAGFVSTVMALRYCVHHYVVLNGERPQTDYLTLAQLIEYLGERMQHKVMPLDPPWKPAPPVW